MLEQAGEIRAVLNVASASYPRLGARAANIFDPRSMLRELAGKILPDGTLADDASVALHRLRRDIERQQKQIQISLERFLRAHHDDGTLQEDFITLRNDRFVVPVVAGQQRKVNGVIHGASGSGHTLFVEPLETIDLNNELVRLREEEQRETLAHPARVDGTAALAMLPRFKPPWRPSVSWSFCSPRPNSRLISAAPFPASARIPDAGWF